MDFRKKLNNFFRNDNVLPDFLIAVSFVIVAVPLWLFLHFWSLLIFAVLAANILILIAHYKKISIPFLSDLVAKEYERIKSKAFRDEKTIQVRRALRINFLKALRHVVSSLGYDLEIVYFKVLHHLALLFRSLEDNHKLLIDWNRPLKVELGKKNLYNQLGESWTEREVYRQEKAALFQAQKRRALRFSTWGSLALITAAFVLSIVFAPQSFAATSSWIQSNWSGGASTVSVAVNPGDKTTWSKYYSKSSTIEASSSVSLNTTSTPTIYTSTADFSANTLVNALAATNSIIMLKPVTARCTKSAECATSLCVSGVCAVQRIWTGAVNSDMNNPANYSGSGALLTTDDLIFNGTSVVNATASADLDVRSVTIASGYTGAWSFSGRSIIVEGGNFSDSGITGSHTYGTGLTFNGAGKGFYVADTGSGISGANCVFTFNSTAQTFYQQRGTTYKSLVVSANASLTLSDYLVTFSNAGYPLVLGNNASLTFSGATIFFNRTNSGDMYSLGSGYSMAADTGMNLQFSANASAASQIINFPALTISGSIGGMYIGSRSGAYSSTIEFTGDINIGTAALTVGSVAAYGDIFNFNTHAITCGNLLFYTGSVEAFDFGGSTFNISTFNYTAVNTPATTLDFGTSTWNCAGLWKFFPSFVIDPGTSIVNFTNTGTITSAGKSFYAVNVNASGKTITLADDMTVGGTCGNYNVLAGTVNLNGHTVINGDPCP